MPKGKRLSQDAKNIAFEYYKQGLSNPDIAEKLSIIVGYQVPVAYINKISWLEKWKTRKSDVDFVTIQKVETELAKRELESKSISEQHAEAFHALWTKAYEAIANGDFHLAKPSDVISAVETGIKGERLVLSGILSAKLVTEILNILMDEIQDENLLRRVGMRLKKAIVDYHINATATATN